MTDKEKLAEVRVLLTEVDTMLRDLDASVNSVYYNLGIFTTRVEELTRPEEIVENTVEV